MLSSDQRRAPPGKATSNRTMSPATTSCMLLTAGMMGQSGCRSNLDPDWMKFHGVHTKIEMEKAPNGRFDSNPSSTFQGAQPFHRPIDSPFTGTTVGKDLIGVSGDGKAAPHYNTSDLSGQGLASPSLNHKPPKVIRTSASTPLPEDTPYIPPNNASPHDTFTSNYANADIQSDRKVPALEDCTKPSHSCPLNHADSNGPTTIQEPTDNDLHHTSTTNANVVYSHDKAIEITNQSACTTRPLTREEQPLQPLALHCQSEYTAQEETWPVRKRDSSIANDAEDVDGGRCSRTSLPLGVRNKKMKPTDCLLYAATLLSKVDAAARSPRPTIVPVPREATAMDYASDASYKDPLQPRDVDVLCGRGGLINKHPGNIVYRKVVDYNKPYYQSVHKKHRILVSQSIVQSILNFGGRFLTLGAKSKTWMEIGYKRAVQKTSQALRERSAAQEDDDDDDEEEEEEDDNVNYRKKKGSADSQEDHEAFRWNPQTNLKKNHEILKGS